MTFIALRCHRCGAYGQSEGLDVFDAEHQAEAAGWVTHAIGYSDGRVAVIDCCPNCLAARSGADRDRTELRERIRQAQRELEDVEQVFATGGTQ
jgi:hypothetical protein